MSKEIAYFETDEGMCIGTESKGFKFHCELDENFEPKKYFITWKCGSVEEVKPHFKNVIRK